jgi:hypothetical protein
MIGEEAIGGAKIVTGKRAKTGEMFGFAAATAIVLAMSSTIAAELPEAVAAKGEAILFQVHAAGAQIYECKADSDGRLAWRFREPIAALFRDGKTVGRHYAGPSWEIEGSTIIGKTAGKAPGASAKDIAWLKLDVVERRGDGPLQAATTVQRLNTAGGNFEGACEKAGDLHTEPYTADYVFLKKSD